MAHDQQKFVSYASGGCEVQVPADLVSGEDYFWFTDICLLPVSSLGRHIQELSGVSVIRSLTSSIRAAPSGPDHLSKVPPCNYHHLEIRFSAYDSGGHRNIHTIAEVKSSHFSGQQMEI